METSPLICSANQSTGFYMITASVMKGLKNTATSIERENPFLTHIHIFSYF